MELAEILGISTNILILCFLASSISLSLKMKRNKSVENVSLIPLALGFFNSCLWLNYGLLQANPDIYIVNIIAAVLNAFHLGCYYCFCPDEAFMHKLFGGIVSSVFVIIGYTAFFANREHGITVAGSIGSIVTLSFVVAPLFDVRNVIRTKSTECLPLPMLVIGSLLGGQFVAYGYLIGDIFMMIPNTIGLAVNIFALSFYFIYPSKPPTKIS